MATGAASTHVHYIAQKSAFTETYMSTVLPVLGVIGGPKCVKPCKNNRVNPVSKLCGQNPSNGFADFMRIRLHLLTLTDQGRKCCSFVF